MATQVYPKANSNDSSAVIAAGTEWEVDGGLKRYKYVQAEDAAMAANQVAEWSDTGGYEVTIDRAGGSSLGRIAAGVVKGTVTDAYFGVIQVAGTCSVLVPAAVAVSAGDALVPHATTNGGVAVATTSTLDQIFAVAVGADDATTSAAGTCVARIVRV